ncbi:p-hydroxybenzoic acid efflux pump subunit AaeA [Thalassocella blandensis]|nr:p-hydroxybenzoic acid efflux pump subunit AaeA [Thalassocella blandensis]
MTAERKGKAQHQISKRNNGVAKRWVIPLFIVSIALLGSVLMTVYSPPPTVKEEPQKAMLVNALEVQKADMTIRIPSQGRVAPHTRTILISEVMGLVTEVSQDFVSGGFVKKGQLLVKLDDRNYRAAVKQAEANVARAKKDLIQVKGQAQVAYQQYKRNKSTKRTSEALSLLLHEPQLEESEANLAFAKAELERIKGDLENTEIRAPYDGLIKSKHIDIGQYATQGTNVAEIIAVDYAEVRLAIPQDRLAYLDLPLITSHSETDDLTLASASEASGSDAVKTQEATAKSPTNALAKIQQETSIQHDAATTAEDSATFTPPQLNTAQQNALPVMLKSVYGDIEYAWPANIVRTEGFFDETSHTLYAVARIEDPYLLKSRNKAEDSKLVPLLMGTYVEAEIEGHRLEDMVKIPRHLLRSGNNVWVIDENNQLRNRKLEILRTGGEDIYVTSGLEQGERICVTNVGEVVPGTSVRVAQSETAETTETAMLYE